MLFVLHEVFEFVIRLEHINEAKLGLQPVQQIPFFTIELSAYKSVSSLTTVRYRLVSVHLIDKDMIRNCLHLKYCSTWGVQVPTVLFAPHQNMPWANTWCSVSIPNQHWTSPRRRQTLWPRHGVLVMSTFNSWAKLSLMSTIFFSFWKYCRQILCFCIKELLNILIFWSFFFKNLQKEKADLRSLWQHSWSFGTRNE